jgi:hypothetical protein
MAHLEHLDVGMACSDLGTQDANGLVPYRYRTVPYSKGTVRNRTTRYGTGIVPYGRTVPYRTIT